MAGDFLDLVTESDTFPYRPVANAELTLRIVPDDVEREIRTANKTTEWHKGQRLTETDSTGFVADVIEHAIVDWKGVRIRGQEVPCTREHKNLLPEWVKSDVVRLCLGKEAGQAPQDEKKS